MNARISVPPVAVPHQPHDVELEAEVIGVALLGYPLPDWLQADDFFSGTMRTLFRAARELGDAASLPAMAALLRDQGHLYTAGAGVDRHSSYLISSVELVAMMQQAEFALERGWAVDFAKLRELRNQRRLLEAMRRVEIAFEHEAMSHREARKALSEHFERSSK